MSDSNDVLKICQRRLHIVRLAAEECCGLIWILVKFQDSTTRLSDRTAAVLLGGETKPNVDSGRYLQILPQFELVLLFKVLLFVNHFAVPDGG